MSQIPPSEPAMGEIRFRFPLIALPLMLLVGMGIAVFGFSRVLLALEPEAATTVALVTAANLLGACAFVALKPEVARRRWAELAAVVVYPVLIGIAIAITGFGTPSEAEPASTAKSSQTSSGGASADLVAENTAFSLDSIDAAAGEDVSFTFDNQDVALHNFALYPDEQAATAQEGDRYVSPDVPAGSSQDISFVAPKEPGDYPFICEYHPATMTGTLVVEAGGGESGDQKSGDQKSGDQKSGGSEGQGAGGGGGGGGDY